MRRFPFTLSSLVMLSLVAIITSTHLGTLSSHWLELLGFAPNDLAAGRFERLFTSALVTLGGLVFWEALGMTALSAGLAEWLTGTWHALLSFWGVHLATLLVESGLFATLLQYAEDSSTRELFWARDVGPSAGYFGCLGLTCGCLPGRWRWLSGILGMTALAIALLLPAQNGESQSIKLAADLAHLIAFPLGWLSAFIKIGEHRSPRRLE